jgi:hypothetical protein
VRERDAQDHVRGDEEGDEESRVRERRRGDNVLPGDVDARKPRGRQEADDEEVDELAIPVGQG